MRTALAIGPGIVADGTSHAANARWGDGSNVRFTDEGQPETIHGWESATPNLLSGVCRTIMPWTDNSAVLNMALGTHSHLQLWSGGALIDITPTLAKPSAKLGADPLWTQAAGVPTVVVSQPGHAHIVGDVITLSGATAVNGVTPSGNVTVTFVTTNTWSFNWTSNASGTGSGGGSNVVVTPQRSYVAGQVDGTGTAGFGTGGFGIGPFGQPSATDYFPRTWSLAAWGQNLLASYRDGPIYGWTNDLAQKAQPLANAPQRVTYMLVAPQRMVFALGCNEEATGKFNPLCIRHSSVGLNTEWNTNTNTTAREYVLPGGGHIVAGRLIGDRILVWTNDALFLGTYAGSVTQPWRFERISKGAGLIGANAAVVRGQTAYWITGDKQIMAYTLGGIPAAVPCSVHADFSDNLAFSQSDKIVASSIGQHSEIRFDYPDRRDGTGLENSRYIAVKVAGPAAGTWYRGVMARTAMVDAGPSLYCSGATAAGNLYWHERGHTADGAALSWFIETADQMLDENTSVLISGMWSDFKGQLGPISVTVTSRHKPNGAAVTKGPYAVAPTDDKTDMRAMGRYHRIRFSGASAPSFATLGQPVFETRPGGTR